MQLFNALLENGMYYVTSYCVVRVGVCKMVSVKYLEKYLMYPHQTGTQKHQGKAKTKMTG